MSHRPQIVVDYIKINKSQVFITLEQSSDYGASEDWYFNQMLVDTSSGDITVTFPADISGFPEGASRHIFNTGDNLVIIDTNGNTIDGDTSDRVIYPDGYVEVQKLDGTVRMVRQHNVGFNVQPDDIANLEVWLEPFDSSTITTTGVLVDQINDKSGNGNHFTGSGVTRPDIETDGISDGKDSILFSASELLTAGDVEVHNNSAGRGLYICALIKPSATSDYFLSKFALGQHEWYMGTTRNRVYEDLTGSYSNRKANLDLDNWQILEIKWTTGEGIKAYVNGSLQGAGEAVTDISDGTASLILGDSTGLAGFVGEIGAIIIYSRELTNTEQHKVRDYLIGSLKLTDLIPSSIQDEIWDHDPTTHIVTLDDDEDILDLTANAFKPRVLAQTTQPTAGTGATQCDSGEMLIWIDTDDSNRAYFVYNYGGTISTWVMD